MTAPAAFKQADVTRAAKGAAKAGLQVGSVRIAPDGSIEVYAAGAVMAPRANPLDEKVFGDP